MALSLSRMENCLQDPFLLFFSVTALLSHRCHLLSQQQCWPNGSPVIPRSNMEPITACPAVGACLAVSTCPAVSTCHSSVSHHTYLLSSAVGLKESVTMSFHTDKMSMRCITACRCLLLLVHLTPVTRCTARNLTSFFK